MQCKAKSKRSGQQCQKDAVVGRRHCHMHGGKSPVGPASPAYRTGKYSKYMPRALKSKYEWALRDTHLNSLRDELAVLQTLIADGLQNLSATGSESTEIADLIERHSRVAIREAKLLELNGQMIPLEQVVAMLDAIAGTVIESVTDRVALNRIANSLAQFSGDRHEETFATASDRISNAS